MSFMLRLLFGASTLLMAVVFSPLQAGAIETPGTAKALDEKSKQAMTQGIPWKRWGQPADIANAVSFLVNDRSDYVTGQVIVVDGGWTIQ